MIWDICIRRPVFTCMLVLAPVVLGLVRLVATALPVSLRMVSPGQS